MAIDIKFDLAGNPELPTIILANRNGNKLGQLMVNIDSINLKDKFNDASEFSFTINKYINNELTYLWDSITDFKLVYCKEWDMWFEIKVKLDEKIETIKTVFCTQLGQAELSQIMLYDVEINTEDDIARDDYKIAILYDPENVECSILGRLLEKAPHYSVVHVDHTVASIQRFFSFDDISIYDALQEVAEEIGCLFVFDSNSDDNGKPRRVISVYDLQQNCNNCGYRGEFTDVCHKCGSTNIKNGYGEDTLIFVTSDELASDGIQLETDTDSMKNCFKLEAGDDLMTATVRNCNPNGSDYIWRFSDNTKEDMPNELVDKINSYDEIYKQYYNEHISNLNGALLNKYNSLVEKYLIYNEDLQRINTPIVGYASLMNAYYNVIDMVLYLESGLMPSVKMSDTTAKAQANLLTSSSLSPVAVSDVSVASLSTVNNAVLAMAKVIVRPTYKVQINTSELLDEDTKRWKGDFSITNYSDKEDTAISSVVTIEINDELETFVKQKIDKALNKENTEDLSISGLFKKEHNEFCEELKKYALNPLTSIHNACQSCIDILIEQGIGSNTADNNSDGDLYESLYVPYYNKLIAIESEIKTREEEISIISGTHDISGNLTSDGLQTNIEKCIYEIQDALNFEKHLGKELWLDFCAYRREDKYLNENYISDGLNNSELFEKAREFFDVAENEIYKSSELQHSISTTLNNLLAIKKFKPLVKSFKTGNWIRVLVDDDVLKLRLLEYEIDYGDFNNINVEFSDVTKIKNGITDLQSVLSQASSMASSYSSVQRQANKGNEAKDVVDNWFNEGLNSALVQIQNNDSEDITITKNGLLCRSYDDVTQTFSPEQLKLTHNIMAYTNDDWKTVRQAIGKHSYITYDENDDAFVNKIGYGINAEFVTAGIISGSQIIGGDIYSDNYSVGQKSGSYLNLTDGTFSFAGGKLTYDGDHLAIDGEITVATTGTIGCWNIDEFSIYKGSNVFGDKDGMYFGTNGLSLGESFKVNSDGSAEASNLTLNGGYLLIGNKENTYAEITEDGVLNCSGANIIGNILVDSGGTVQISAGDSEGSFINFGEAFSVSNNGVSATSGNFASLKVNGKDVITEDNLGLKVIVSVSEPNERGIIWMCPTSVKSVSYSGFTSSERDNTVYIANKSQTFALSGDSSDVLANSTFKYTIKFPVYLALDGAGEKDIKFSAIATKSSNTNLRITFPEYTLASIRAWETQNIEMTVESTVNLCGDSDDIEITISSQNAKTSGRLYINRNSYISLTVSDVNDSVNTQSCSVYYKP